MPQPEGHYVAWARFLPLVALTEMTKPPRRGRRGFALSTARLRGGDMRAAPRGGGDAAPPTCGVSGQGAGDLYIGQGPLNSIRPGARWSLPFSRS
jgi:hypothetical protein